MQLDAGALLCAGLSIFLLMLSGFWTDRTYRKFDNIPGHYDFRGKATRLVPRRQMAWLLPVMFSLMLLFFIALFELMPSEMQNGDPTWGLVFVSLTLLVSQGMVLWLLGRWARSQGGNP